MDFFSYLSTIWGIALFLVIILLLVYVIVMFFIIRWLIKQAMKNPGLVITISALLVFGGIVLIVATSGTLTVPGIGAIVSGIITIVASYKSLNKGIKK